MRGAALALTLGLMAGAAHAAPASEPGVSRELARWRAAHYRDVRYALALRVAGLADKLEGSAQIELTLPRNPPELVIDWRPSPTSRVWDLRVNGEPALTRFEREHLIVPARQLHAGRNRVTLEFESPIAISGGAVTRYLDREDGSKYVYTLFVPADASSVFPCFDQPDLKGRFTLDLTVPGAWTAVANAKLVAAEDAPEGMRRFRFAPTRPISTYLFAFATGPFAEFADSTGSTRLLARKSRLARAGEEAPEVLRLNREARRWFERYFDFRFPFPKYDLVLIPELAYGGMEHAGATFLREDAVLFPSVPNETDILSRAQLVFHETAHQWFGDLVTMRWFDDLWLKEGFANLMAAKAAEALLPGMPVWTAFHALKTSAYRTDVTQGTTPIYRPLANLSAAKSAYGNIVYGKAPGVLRQAEFYIGETAFREAVRQFLRRHAWAAAGWSDLVASLEGASGRDLKGWAEAWVERRGMPEVRLVWTADNRGRLKEAYLGQRDVLGGGRAWPMKLKLLVLTGGSSRTFDATLRGAQTRIAALEGAPQFDFAFANTGDYAYGRFLLDERSRRAVLARPDLVQGELLRSLVFDALWESVRDAELAPRVYIDFVLRVAPAERDPVTLAALLARAQAAFSTYFSDAQRDAAAPGLEQLLTDGMLHADSAGRRIAFFRTFVAAAWSEDGRARLKSLLAGALRIPEVELSARDRFRIVARLLALGDAQGTELLAARTAAESGDDARRYAFAAGAAERSAEAKRAYFERFLSDTGLAESWVDAALFPLNSVEHAALTAPLLQPALDALSGLERTRKIFFVNAWLSAFVGGQLDAQALAHVERAAQNPKLDPELRLKLLEAMDGLARTVKIRARFAS